MIEPGPVQTDFIANIGANKTGSIFEEDVPKDPDADKLTLKLQQATMENSKSYLAAAVRIYVL